jgi:hypothetical protein
VRKTQLLVFNNELLLKTKVSNAARQIVEEEDDEALNCNNNTLETLHNSAKLLLTHELLKKLQNCRNPTLAKCGGEAQHLEKVRIWSPPGFPNVQSSTARPKTPRIEVFLVSLERS